MVLPSLAPAVPVEELVLVLAEALCRLSGSQHVPCRTTFQVAELLQDLFTHMQQLSTMPFSGLLLAGHTLVNILGDYEGMMLIGCNSAFDVTILPLSWRNARGSTPSMQCT